MLSSRHSVRMCKYGEACLKPQEILREETNIEPDHKDPEEPFSNSFVQLVAEHFGYQKINPAKQANTVPAIST